MIGIFAKYKTTEKVLYRCVKGNTMNVIKILNKKFGNEWVFVDVINENEILKFDDELEYKGFEENTKRYANNIYSLVNIDRRSG